MIEKVKEKIIGEKGVNLISLTIAVTVILILTGTIIVSSVSSLKSNKLRNMQADIDNLRDKVSNYYSNYGEIPADKKIEYTNVEHIRSSGVISEVVDTGAFYVIDLSAIENVTLNYGKDYDKIRNGEATTEEEINKLTDLYIINGESHNIFYVAGIELDGEKFYTDYTSEEADTVAVDLRYVDGVKIPEDFYYVGGSKEEGLVISDVQGDDLENSKGGNQFVWIPVENRDLEEDKENFATDEKEFVDSVNNNKGFYLGRYEAGIEGTDEIDITNNFDDSWAKADSELWTGWKGGNLVTKKDAKIWNYITVKKAMEVIEEKYNTENIKGRILSLNAYNKVLEFLGKANDTSNFSDWGNRLNSEFNIDSPNAKEFINERDVLKYVEFSGTKKANEPHLLTSGASERNKIKNIYDLSGNVWEYTTNINKIENNTTYINYVSGSAFGDEKIITNNTMNVANDDMGFRVVLYIPEIFEIQNERITKNEEGTINLNTQIEGTKGYINFDVVPKEGYTLESISPKLPYKVTENGKYTFTIKLKNEIGKEIEVKHTVKVNNYVTNPNYWIRFNGGSHIEFSNVNQNTFYNHFTIAIKVKINRKEQASKNYMGLWGNHVGNEGLNMQFRETTTTILGTADMTNYYDRWVDIVETFNGSSMKVYIDGELKSTQSTTRRPYKGFNVGTSYLNSDRQMLGEMSCLKIWNKALTDEEVAEMDLFKEDVNVGKDSVYFNLNLKSKKEVESLGGKFVGSDYKFFEN